jgi:uncharacterized membrane protein YoaK (UPF0700 family)
MPTSSSDYQSFQDAPLAEEPAPLVPDLPRLAESSRRSRALHRAATALFCFAAGYVDGNTKLRFGTFGSLMTGNAVALGMAASAFDGETVALCAASFVGFAAGVGMVSHALGYDGEWLDARCGRGGKRKPIPAAVRWQAMLVMAVLIAACDATFTLADVRHSSHQRWWATPRYAGALASAAMGVQDMLTLQGALQQHTAVHGGTIVTLSITCHKWAARRASYKELAEGFELAQGVFGYVAGAGAGAAAVAISAHWSLWPVLLLLLFALHLEPRLEEDEAELAVEQLWSVGPEKGERRGRQPR